MTTETKKSQKELFGLREGEEIIGFYVPLMQRDIVLVDDVVDKPHTSKAMRQMMETGEWEQIRKRISPIYRGYDVLIGTRKSQQPQEVKSA